MLAFLSHLLALLAGALIVTLTPLFPYAATLRAWVQDNIRFPRE